MKSEDGKKFQKKMIEIFSIYQREISDLALRAWWRIFDGYSWEVIEVALDQHVRQSRFFPTPADIFEILQKNQIQEIPAADRRSIAENRSLIATQKILRDLRMKPGNPDAAARSIGEVKKLLNKRFS